MARFIIRRFFSMLVVLVAIITFVFLITHLLPADPARVAAGFNAGPAQVEAVRESLGLDKPLTHQYVIYMSRLVQLDFGMSIRSRQPVAVDLETFLPATLELTLVGMAVYITLSLILGVAAAVSRRKRRSMLDSSIRLLSMGGHAIPAFWAALLLQLTFFRWLGILPSGGRLDFTMTPPDDITGLYLVDSLLTLNWLVFVDAAEHLVLPVTALVLGPLPVGIRMVRQSVLAELSLPYAQTARSKGLGERIVLMRHVLPNALIPIITLFGTQLGYLIGGAFLVEAIFLWPGVGRYAVTSIEALDFNAVIGITVVVAVAFLVINFLTDLCYGLLDPRVRMD